MGMKQYANLTRNVSTQTIDNYEDVIKRKQRRYKNQIFFDGKKLFEVSTPT